MTNRQSNNQWSGGIAAHPAPKISECKNPLENFSPQFFWDQDVILLIDYLPKGQTINAEYYITHLCWCNWRIFWRKNAAGSSQRGSCSCRTMPRLTALATQKKLACLGFHCLDHPPHSPDLAPSDYHLIPGLKNNWKVAIFRPTRRSLLPRRPGWTENILIFFRVTSDLEQRAKKYIDLRGEYVE